MTPEERAREALLRCISKPRYVEAYEPEIAAAIRAAVQEERELCAAKCDALALGFSVESVHRWMGQQCAAAIRARGKEPK